MKLNTAAVAPLHLVRMEKNVVIWRVTSVRRGKTAAVPNTVKKLTETADVVVRA